MTSSDSAETLWDQRYRSSHRVWSGDPNSQLVAEVTGLPPGSALDAGCGEGADSLDQDQWEVLVSEARSHSTLDPDGRSITVYDEVLVARRRTEPEEPGEAPSVGSRQA